MENLYKKIQEKLAIGMYGDVISDITKLYETPSVFIEQHKLQESLFQITQIIQPHIKEEDRPMVRTSIPMWVKNVAGNFFSKFT